MIKIITCGCLNSKKNIIILLNKNLSFISLILQQKHENKGNYSFKRKSFTISVLNHSNNVLAQGLEI